IRFLCARLQDSDEWPRREAASALGQLGPAVCGLTVERGGVSIPLAVLALERRLTDRDLDVQVKAAWALWKVAGRSGAAIPVFERVVQPSELPLVEGVSSPRVTAIRSLGRIGEVDPRA